jgi:hypothetical protein
MMAARYYVRSAEIAGLGSEKLGCEQGRDWCGDVLRYNAARKKSKGQADKCANGRYWPFFCDQRMRFRYQNRKASISRKHRIFVALMTSFRSSCNFHSTHGTMGLFLLLDAHKRTPLFYHGNIYSPFIPTPPLHIFVSGTSGCT